MGGKKAGWWDKGSIRIGSGFANAWEIQDLNLSDIPGIAGYYSAVNANAVHLSPIRLGEGCGTDTDGFYFKSSVEPNDNPDLLEAYVREFHKKCIRVIIYFNGHSFVPNTYKKYPEWVMVNESCNPVLTIYNTGMSACPNNENFRKWQAGVIRNLCRYEIDGVFLDGDIFFASTCYCDTCRTLFLDKYGMEMPGKSEHKHPNWKYLRQFQIDSLTSYVETLYKVLKECRPEALLYCNSGLRAANWTTGRQNRRLIETQDMLLSEGGFIYGNFNHTFIWRTECENKLCKSQSKGKPVISGIATAHKPWNYYNMSTVEVKLMMFSAIATGSHIWTGFPSSKNDQTELMREVYETNKFIADNESILFPTESMAKVAIVWSNVNADFYSGSEIKKTDFTEEDKGSVIGSAHLEFEGFYDMCFRNHLPVDVIDEVSLTDKTINRYDVVILPNLACMSDLETESVREYIKNGGVLISTFETSMYNEIGESRTRFGLNDVFGIDSHEGLFGPSLFNYVMPVEDKTPVIKSFAKYKYIPSPKYGLKISRHKAQKIMNYAQLLKGRYDRLPVAGEDGFLFTNSFGKGKSVYFSGTVGQAAAEWYFREYYDIMDEILKMNSKQQIRLTGSSESVSLNLMKNINTGDIIIYLTNFTGAMNRPIREVCAISEIKLELGFKVAGAKCLFSKNNINVQYSKGGSLLTIGRLNEFEAILLTL